MSNYIISILVAILVGASAYFFREKWKEEKQINRSKIPSPVRKWEKQVKRASDEFGVPYQIAHAVLWQESAGDPAARSKAGAIGLMQLKPIAVKDVQDIKGDFSGWKVNEEQNIRAGVAFLKRQKERTGNWQDAIKAYYQGFEGMKTNQKIASEYLEEVTRKSQFFA